MQCSFKRVVLLKYFATILFISIHSRRGLLDKRLENPHVAFLGNEKAGIHCHGSILKDRIILTAALCLSGMQNASDLFIIVGTKLLDEKYERIQVSSWIKHPEYSQHDLRNNVALLLLSSPVKFSAYVKKVLLSDNFPATGTIGYVAGYAITRVDWKLSLYLTFHVIRELVESDARCRNIFPYMKSNEFCTEFHDNSHIFRGEPGSALIVRGYEQIGILSYAIEKTTKSAISFFNPICAYKNWIEDNVIQLQDIECRQKLFRDKHN